LEIVKGGKLRATVARRHRSPAERANIVVDEYLKGAWQIAAIAGSP